MRFITKFGNKNIDVSSHKEMPSIKIEGSVFFGNLKNECITSCDLILNNDVFINKTNILLEIKTKDANLKSYKGIIIAKYNEVVQIFHGGVDITDKWQDKIIYV